MSVSEWAMKNGLIQCMGCMGYGKAEHVTYHLHKRYKNYFHYCTPECAEKDGAEKAPYIKQQLTQEQTNKEMKQ
tara:strand:- start:62 stop:283 length:222 start_codon:yes stop_codon:yes gene_type:complete